MLSVTFEYYSILVYVLVVFFVVFLLLFITFFLAPTNTYRDKISPYECGFHPFEDARKEFSVHFYLVALLFVAFDLEVLILVPWVINVSCLTTVAFWGVVVFLALILGGFIYEWVRGALDW